MRGVADIGVVEVAHKFVASVGLGRNPAVPAEEVVVVDALL